jgi:hypothetical protein
MKPHNRRDWGLYREVKRKRHKKYTKKKVTLGICRMETTLVPAMHINLRGYNQPSAIIIIHRLTPTTHQIPTFEYYNSNTIYNDEEDVKHVTQSIFI